MKIIAEIGSNWRTFNDCLISIEKAKEAGANYVKFQLFNQFELFAPENKDEIKNYIELIGTTPFLDPNWIPLLAAHCKKHEIEFLCTGFSPQGYDLIDPFVNMHKIASAELTDISILNKVNSLGKPVMLSTGGSDINLEIKNALLYLKDVPVTIMLCTADYPARFIDFRKLDYMKYVFGENYSYGFSDHSIDVLNIPMMAKDRRCSIIEKHVSFIDGINTNDSLHSLSYDEFRVMCDRLRDQEHSIDQIEHLANKEMKSKYKRRFVATKNISPGDSFLIGVNVNYLRSKRVWDNPVLTFRPWDLNNKKSLSYKYPGDVISYADIEIEID